MFSVWIATSSSPPLSRTHSAVLQSATAFGSGERCREKCSKASQPLNIPPHLIKGENGSVTLGRSGGERQSHNRAEGEGRGRRPPPPAAAQPPPLISGQEVKGGKEPLLTHPVKDFGPPPPSGAYYSTQGRSPRLVRPISHPSWVQKTGGLPLLFHARGVIA